MLLSNFRGHSVLEINISIFKEDKKMTISRRAAQVLEDLKTLKVITSDDIIGTIPFSTTGLKIGLSIPESDQKRRIVVKNAFYQEFESGVMISEVLDSFCISISAN